IYPGPPGVATFIAPNVPHYFLWSALGDAVSYVAATEGGLALAVSSLDGSLSEHPVAVGAPMFHAWSDDGAFLALHAGPRLALFDRTTLALTEVHDNTAGFRTPRFSASGDLLYAAPAGDGIALLARVASGDTRRLAVFDGGVALDVFTDELFVAVTHQADAALFDSLWRVAADGSGRECVWRGPFGAFWVAPDGEAVVFLVPAQSGDGRVALQARGRFGEILGATESFVPSDDLRVASAFFDQYSLSHSPWSPGGDMFAVCGRLATDGVSASFGDPIGDYVMTWRPVRSQPLELLAPGTFASFARRVAGDGATQ
ncbi:MAG: hypothetical protein ACRDHF_09990, partial [Tepidiformaceae bacterium]